MTNIQQFQLEFLEFLESHSGQHKQADLQKQFESYPYATFRDGIKELADKGLVGSQDFLGNFQVGVGKFQINAAGLQHIKDLKGIEAKERKESSGKAVDTRSKIATPIIAGLAMLISALTFYFTKCQKSATSGVDLEKLKTTLDTTNARLASGVDELKGIKNKIKKDTIYIKPAVVKGGGKKKKSKHYSVVTITTDKLVLDTTKK